MEVALSLRNFSYYTSTESVFIQGTVYKKTQLELNQKIDRHFEDVQINSKISFKASKSDPELIRLLLTERIVKIRSTEILKPIDSTRSVTYLAESIKQCAI